MSVTQLKKRGVVRWMRTMGLLFTWVGIGVVLLAGTVLPVRATKFEYPPDISSRKVVLTWQPDSSGTILDPYYSGNAVLKQEFQHTQIHIHPVRLISLGGGGTQVYSYAVGEPFIRHWEAATGDTVRPDYITTEGAELVSMSLHSSEAFLVAATTTQEIGFWRLGHASPHPTFRSARGPILALQFLPAGADTGSVRFIVLSEDSVRVWNRPGDPSGAAGEVVGRATSALALIPRPASNDFLVAVGTQAGTIRVWNSVALGTTNLILGNRDPHPAPVARIAFSPDSRRLVSTDTQGEVRIWRLSDGALLSKFQTGDGAPFLAFSPPYGTLLLVGLPDGTVEARNGLDGGLYRRENFVRQTLSSMVLSPGGGLLVLGDARGIVTGMQAGYCKVSVDQPRCFGGYIVWRSPTPDPADKELLRVYTFGDSTWSFAAKTRSFSDPDSIIPRTFIPPRGTVTTPVTIAGPHNGIPYFYSLTRFDFVYQSQGVFPQLVSILEGKDAVLAGFYRDPNETEPTPVIPRPSARTALPQLGEIRVVPNPYERGKSGWELPGEMHVEFQNLPEKATLRIYTLGGDFVREVTHDLDKYGKSSSTISWDLKNSSGRWVVSGVYLYQAKSPSGEVEQGYFTVIL